MLNFDQLNKYKFHENLVLRIAKRPIDINNRGNKVDLHKFLLEEDEAIYLSSKDFHAEIRKDGFDVDSHEKTEKHLKVIRTAYSYMSRMTFKTTPFGLFAGCGVINWGHCNIIKLNNSFRHTKLESKYLYDLIVSVLRENPALNNQLSYFTNSSLYKTSNSYKFYTNNDNGEAIITNLEKSPVLTAVTKLCSGGAFVDEIYQLLSKFGNSHIDCVNFVKQLIEIGFLESELHQPVMQKDVLTFYIDIFEKRISPNDIIGKKIIGLLKTLRRGIRQIDENFRNNVDEYVKLIEQVKEALSTPTNKRSDFNVELNFDCEGSTLNSALKAKIKKGIWAINKFVDNKDYNRLQRLDKFKQKFKCKFGYKPVLLTTALDLDTGVDYGNITDNQKAKSETEVSNNFYLHKLLASSFKTGLKVIKLNRTELQNLKSVSENLPKMMAIQFSIIPETTDNIHLKYIWNTSGIDIINRFSSGNSEIKQTIDSISQIEESIYNDALIMEVFHAPNASVVNISATEIINKFYIRYQCNQSSQQDHTEMNLSDIKICLLEDELVLYSNKYKKRIIPRINNLVSSDYYKLPLIKFLFDISLEPFKHVYCFDWIVNWDLFSHFDFLPRIEYEDVIISPAIWRLRTNEIKEITSFSQFNRYRTQRDIPRFVIFKATNGSELHLDLHNQISFEILRANCKGDFLVLNESLNVERSGLVVDGNNDRYASEVFAFVSNRQKYEPSLYPSPLSDILTASTKKQHHFLPGEDWLYYKIYCDEHEANELLISLNKKVVNSLRKENLIEKYFFIRYRDPDFHIRLRLFVPNAANLKKIITVVNMYIRRSTSVHSILIDIYEREILRYGKEVISYAEDIFFIDTKYAFKLINLSNCKDDVFFYTMIVLSVNHLLEDFGYTTIQNKEKVISILAKAYQKEFSVKEPDRYKRGRSKLLYQTARKYILDGKLDRKAEGLGHIFNNKSAENRAIVKQMSNVLAKQQKLTGSDCNEIFDIYIPSYIHMMLNRILTSNPRWNEMVIYTILDIVYKEKKARSPKE